MTQEQSFFEDVVCSDETITLLVTVEDMPVGTIGLSDVDDRSRSAELGYWIAPDSQGEGYGTEAAELLVDFGFRHYNLHRIYARVFEFNRASQRLLEKVGFIEEGEHREAYFIDGKYQNVYWYGLLEEEWESGKSV